MENLPAAPVLCFFHTAVGMGGKMGNICWAHRDVTRRPETSLGKMLIAQTRDVCV